MKPKKHSPESPIFRASITGIDGSGKDTVAKTILGHLAGTGMSVFKLGRPAYKTTGEGLQQVYMRTTEGLDSLHHFADTQRSKKLISCVNATNVILQTRLLERLVVRQHPDIILSSRDPIVDPAVYYDFYSEVLSEKISMTNRILAMQQLTGVRRDMIIRLKVDPEVAVNRIEKRMGDEETQRSNSQGSLGMRDKWRHMHENTHDLSMLDGGYERALEIVQKVSPATTIIEIDTNDITRHQVAKLAHATIVSAMTGDIDGGERMLLPTTNVQEPSPRFEVSVM